MQTALLDRYKLSTDIIHKVFDELLDFVKSKGAVVRFEDLSRVIETEIFDVDPELLKDAQHHETALSNGLEIFLHNDLDDVGIAARAYDLLHVGAGHYWQWNSDKKSGLNFYGDYAWEIGTHFYLGKPFAEIKIVKDYEAEAGSVGLSNLRRLFNNGSELSKVEQAAVLVFFNDYLQTDVEYITKFYLTGELPDMYSVWKYNSPQVPIFDIHFDIQPKLRTNKCIPLIRGRN